MTRPFYWSVKRELWENRALFIAPLVAGGVVLAGYVMGSWTLPGVARKVAASAESAQSLEGPFSFAAFAVLTTSILVAVFYCLGALGGEQRDRSLLFWKSLPVSDLKTVAAKAFVPMVVTPAVVLAVAVATQLAMLIWGSVVLLLANISPAILWSSAPLPSNASVLAYVLIALSLWYAPLWGWLLLVSAWARRMAILWAIGVPGAAAVFLAATVGPETAYRIIPSRLVGGIPAAFASKVKEGKPEIDFERIDPAGFLASPGLWLGLIVAALFFAGAVHLRRSREPNG
jgi:ABC-2 type transport system permease protein